MKLITGSQMRAARALLRWSAEDLAKRAKLGVATVRRAEAHDGASSLTEANVEAIRAALESTGVEFTNGEQPGVRLAKRSETVADLTRQINTLQADMTPVPGSTKPSPNRAMKQLRHARDQNKLVALKNRRAKSRKEAKK